MRAVIQRVERASVTVGGEPVGAIGAGFMVLIGVENGDTEKDAKYTADKIAGLRVFEDENDKMNLSVQDVGGEILAVSQFTLLGDARGGRRPSFIAAEKPDRADELYEQCVKQIREKGIRVETGRFRTHMKVELINDGPVTILIDSKKVF
ncbi:MAG: D-aminoacyl-tRNA deacylase [Eubacteriales bacterium]|nr:D-aminoacyl-tRNA deacylase [Eubacteriales bacterium]MDD3882423.1 D-aminoacyl-tRNA deacylase [Eubacteriales bacterium]MDD4513804.1 D-aminoacyl-tRNA deacylase [Eubacteriales bacterium]